MHQQTLQLRGDTSDWHFLLSQQRVLKAPSAQTASQTARATLNTQRHVTTCPARASVNLVGKVPRALMTSMSARAVRVETTASAATLRAAIFVHVTQVTPKTLMESAEVMTQGMY